VNRHIYRLAWLFCLLMAVTLSCNALTGLEQDARTTRGTLAAAATDMMELVTQAKSLATEVEESGVVKTSMAYATEEGSQLLATLEAVATTGIEFGDAPPDIPIIALEDIVNFVGTNQLVSYTARLNLAQVVDFYQREMPANGWEPSAEGNSQTKTSVVLRFVKPNKSATITITVNPLDNNSAVVIFIQPQ
jgi:hypothetical protein